eukprot:Nitzschia sp. Nitz4//scaffold256_size27904//7299//10763//NITZ4_008167-RA/size27904-processed-gene-0.12-mRNA-1//-1//CDS//3329544405//1828//frame0
MRTQVPYSMPKARSQSPRSFVATKKAPSKAPINSEHFDKPEDLGTILRNNHGVLNHIVDFSEFESSKSLDQFSVPSVSSSADLARAQMSQQHSSEERAPFVSASLPPTTSSENREPPELKYHHQQNPAREQQETALGSRLFSNEQNFQRSKATTSAPNQDFQLQMDQARMRQAPDESQWSEPPPTRRPQHYEAYGMGADIGHWPEQHPIHPRAEPQYEGYTMGGQYGVPVANEIERGPTNQNLRQHYPVQDYRSGAFQSVDQYNPQPIPQHALADEALSSPVSTLEDRNFAFQCHDVSNRFPSKPQEPQKPPLSKPQAESSSILDLLGVKGFLNCTPTLPSLNEPTDDKAHNSLWSYLDPVDDAAYYSGIRKSADSSDSSDDDINARGKASNRSRRRSKSPISYHQAYADLMFIDPPTQRPMQKSRPRPSSRLKPRSTTPVTTGSRSSNSDSSQGTPIQETKSRPNQAARQKIRKELYDNVPDYKKKNDARESPADAANPSTLSRGRSNSRSSQSIAKGPASDGDMFDPFSIGTRQSRSRESDSDTANLTQATPKVSNATPTKTNRRSTFSTMMKGTNQQRQRSRSLTGTLTRNKVEREQPATTSTPVNQSRRKSNGARGAHGTPGLDGSQQNTKRDGSQGTNGSDQERRRQEHALEVVRQRSMKNVQKLNRLNQNGAPKSPRQPSKPERLIEMDDFDPFGIGQTAVSSNSRGSTKPKQSTKKSLSSPTNYAKSPRGPRSIGTRSDGTRSDARSRSQAQSQSTSHSHVHGHYMYVAYSRFGDNSKNVIQLCEHQSKPIPDPRNAELMVKVTAASISATDCDIRRGEWCEVRLNPYIIPGVALLGTIHLPDDRRRVPMLTSGYKHGDSVLAMVVTGGNARYACVPKDRMVKVPASLPPARAVCLVETYLSAFQALHIGQRGAQRYKEHSLKGQSILILGGSSSLGRALIELALAGGVEYCYALVKPKQFDSIKRMGAIPLPKDPQEWLTLIGHQIGLMVAVRDSKGIYTDAMHRDHLKALRADGQVVFIGQPGVDNRPPTLFASPSPNKLICKSVKGNLKDRTHSYNVFDAWNQDARLAKKDLEHLIGLLEQHHVRPEVLDCVPLSKVAKVHSILETKKISGYIVCSPWMEDSMLLDEQRDDHDQGHEEASVSSL